jgi:hypothetical protein
MQDTVHAPSARRFPPIDAATLRAVWPLVQRAHRCTLVTQTATGEHQARALRLHNHSLGFTVSLWFCVARQSDAAQDIRREPRVSVDVMDAMGARTIHLIGHAAVLEQRPSPVLLHPGVPQPAMAIHADEIDFTLLRVDVEEVTVEAWERVATPAQCVPSSLVPKILSPASPNPGMM